MLLLNMDYILTGIVLSIVDHILPDMIFIAKYEPYIRHQSHSEYAIGDHPPAPYLNSFRTILTIYTVKIPSFR
jgi:hypothetical protein